MKKTVNFRFGEETLALLASLAERWGLTRTAAIERALVIADMETDSGNIAARITEGLLAATGATPDKAAAAVAKARAPKEKE